MKQLLVADVHWLLWEGSFCEVLGKIGITLVGLKLYLHPFRSILNLWITASSDNIFLYFWHFQDLLWYCPPHLPLSILSLPTSHLSADTGHPFSVYLLLILVLHPLLPPLSPASYFGTGPCLLSLPAFLLNTGPLPLCSLRYTAILVIHWNLALLCHICTFSLSS